MHNVYGQAVTCITTEVRVYNNRSTSRKDGVVLEPGGYPILRAARLHVRDKHPVIRRGTPVESTRQTRVSVNIERGVEVYGPRDLRL